MSESPVHQYLYRAVLTRVVDGDTFVADVDLGFGVTKTDTFRLYGVDTPETWRPRTRAERLHGLHATAMVKEWQNHRVLIKTYRDRTGKYGRMLADIWHPGHQTWLSDELRRRDLVKRDHYED